MKVLLPTKYARYIFALLIAFFAIGHFMNNEMLSTMVPFGGSIMVYITGATMIAAVVAFLLGKQVRLAGYLLAAQLVLTAILVHGMSMGGAEDEMAKGMAMMNMVKDLGLALASIAFANDAEG